MDDFQSLYSPIEGEKQMVEAILQEQMKDVPEELSIPASSILFANGKRLRPILLLNICKMLGRIRKEAYYLAAAVELIHTASLIHDDIIDDADIRRGVPTVNTKWGSKIAVLAGDLLVAKAAKLVIKYGDRRIFSLIADVVEKMSKGEALELSLRGKKDITEKDYLRVINLKTASLFATAARIGAIIGGANQRQEKLLFLFGRNLGLAFQITDDILNITSEEKVMGKPTISDIKEGNFTLPYLLLLKSGGFRELIKMDPNHIREVLGKSGVLAKSEQKARSYIERAKRYLEHFPPSPAKEALLKLCDFIIGRRK